MNKEHHYALTVKWTGNTGKGTADYRAYERSHSIIAAGKTVIEGSSDPAFRGDPSRHNPEDLFLSSLSACHMLWYLSLCAVAGVVVVDYYDEATGIMVETEDGGGHFVSVTLHPVVTVSDERMTVKANALHEEARARCFIANSCNFPVRHRASCHVEGKKAAL